MIRIVKGNADNYQVDFYFKNDTDLNGISANIREIFGGEYLQSVFLAKENGTMSLLVGLGTEINDRLHIKELSAKAVKQMKLHKINTFSMNIGKVISAYGIDCIRDIAEGLMLGCYEQVKFPAQDREDFIIDLNGIPDKEMEAAKFLLKETIPVIEGVRFARDMVNLPGNQLRPAQFAEEIKIFLKDTGVKTELFDYAKLKKMGMGGLTAVGESSEFPPCFMIVRYLADPDNQEITALVGKGVTCDTGGYCLKPAASMLGIKGDMAGGAAVTGAIYALAKNKVKTNVIGLIPICENRISPGSLLPGDVITSYSGKTIEVINTDAEGRLILADTVAYATANEKVTRVLDIATLTGAVVNMLGFSVAGVVTDDQKFFEEFRSAYKISGERYWRLPVYPEHEKMIKSKIADIKNMGEKHCGTITAGLFIKAFANGLPWLHIDIAGTAWVDSPIFEYQSQGATGAGVTSIYYLCNKNRSTDRKER
ncbi:leucyl aminopeptidase family protein [Anaerocolumna sp. MB42-C2]|uniref:leucyl aminopeptidase family protein n=1 Tax=Anaerocolumna sp. MB42-C2 TaxID=3070997 RepID=UPI0027E0F40C|nr:leucyl aminopeptidase [Anaerocolumna sp. MB42-C2]WMJ89418.1 leucyl aminopeptidase [Anaerocolumna sp. MB42-C2]